MDLAKTFQKYALKHAFFYVTLDPERALGLEDILPNYTIICPYKSQLTESLHRRLVEELEYSHDRENIIDRGNITRRVLVLEKHLSPGEVDKIVERGTYGILQSEFVRAYINRICEASDLPQRGEGSRTSTTPLKPRILVLKNSQLIEDFCKKQGWHLLAPKASVAEKFENKISQYKILKSIVPYPTSNMLSVEQLYKSFQGGGFNLLGSDPDSIGVRPHRKRKPSERFVLQFNRGHSGNSTFFIQSSKDIANLYKLYPKREAKISKCIKGKTYTLNCLVLGNGAIITGSLSEQITGLKTATNNPNTTVGNDFDSPRKLDAKIVKKIQEIAEAVGKALHQKGYCGLFGIDVIIENGSSMPYFIEVNTHQPASISFEAKLHRTIGKIPLLAYFILDRIGAKIKLGKKDLPPMILPIYAKQIIYRNKTSKILHHKNIVRKYKGKGLVSRMKFVKPNEEIYRRQLPNC